MDALKLFSTLAGKRTDECDPPLKRVPKGHFPYNVGIRVFVAEFLPKINDRLWGQTQDKDILLLRKLETSPYDAMELRMYNSDSMVLMKKVATNESRMAMESLAKSNRNHNTDWNVMKGTRTKKAR